MKTNSKLKKIKAYKANQESLRIKAIKLGVNLIAPETIFLSGDTKFGKNVTINPYVVIGKKVKIGNDVINSDKIKNYYRYPLDKTPLNFILDKKFLISKMKEVENDKNYPFYYVFNFEFENNLIKIFFDKASLDLIGWETKDIYQNQIQTFLSDININVNVEEKIFSLQKYIN